MALPENPQPRVGVWRATFEGQKAVFWRTEKAYSPTIFVPRSPLDLANVEGLVRLLHSEATAGAETAQTEAQRHDIYRDLRKIAVQF